MEATSTCTLAKFRSVSQPACPAPSTAARAFFGKTRTIQPQMLRPSMRMKSTLNTVSSAPVSTWPSVEPMESAPEM